MFFTFHSLMKSGNNSRRPQKSNPDLSKGSQVSCFVTAVARGLLEAHAQLRRMAVWALVEVVSAITLVAQSDTPKCAGCKMCTNTGDYSCQQVSIIGRFR